MLICLRGVLPVWEMNVGALVHVVAAAPVAAHAVVDVVPVDVPVAVVASGGTVVLADAAAVAAFVDAFVAEPAFVVQPVDYRNVFQDVIAA